MWTPTDETDENSVVVNSVSGETNATKSPHYLEVRPQKSLHGMKGRGEGRQRTSDKTIANGKPKNSYSRDL